MKKNIIIISILLFVCLIPINTFGKSKNERQLEIEKGRQAAKLVLEQLGSETQLKIKKEMKKLETERQLVIEREKKAAKLEFEKGRKAAKLEFEQLESEIQLKIKKEKKKLETERQLVIERELEIERQKRQLEIENLEATVKFIPVSNYGDNLDTYKRLLDLDPLNKRYEKKVKFYRHKIKLNREKKRKEKEREREKKREEKEREREEKERESKEKEREMVSKGYALKLVNWNWNSEHGYATAKGEVKNITNKRLKNIKALVSWYNANGDFITSDGAIIEYNILMPGQTSPFEVMERFNPQMNEARIEFKFLFGSKIPFYKN